MIEERLARLGVACLWHRPDQLEPLARWNVWLGHFGEHMAFSGATPDEALTRAETYKEEHK